jgi:hypothetical protein
MGRRFNTSGLDDAQARDLLMAVPRGAISRELTQFYHAAIAEIARGHSENRILTYDLRRPVLWVSGSDHPGGIEYSQISARDIPFLAA